MRLKLTTDEGVIVAHYDNVTIESGDGSLRIVAHETTDDDDEQHDLLLKINKIVWDELFKDRIAQEPEAVEFTEHVFVCESCKRKTRISRDAFIDLEENTFGDDTPHDDADVIMCFQFCWECVAGEPLAGEHDVPQD